MRPSPLAREVRNRPLGGSRTYAEGMRKVVGVLGFILGAYLIVRAIAEPFVIDMSDPATYRNDWGGPSLAGVVAVHSGPGLIAAALMIWALMRRRSRLSR
ncbi:hypothetical protein Psi02_67190 [Planotetraspora silvatica]|uniref:Uncharacterized protein n=2 Tax=Planotetraspora silvatica TaxID=234614 RepID=A0A8J3V5B8_9ACTN|nr:hypothetical protein Psi02_67190 [Planotetraspora silvatica]